MIQEIIGEDSFLDAVNTTSGLYQFGIFNFEVFLSTCCVLNCGVFAFSKNEIFFVLWAIVWIRASSNRHLFHWVFPGGTWLRSFWELCLLLVDVELCVKCYLLHVCADRTVYINRVFLGKFFKGCWFFGKCLTFNVVWLVLLIQDMEILDVLCVGQ